MSRLGLRSSQGGALGLIALCLGKGTPPHRLGEDDDV